LLYPKGTSPMHTITHCIALLVPATATLLPVHATTGTSRFFEHDVLLDGKPIGFHRFTLQDTESGVRLDAQARFVVKVLGLKVFDYDRRVVEHWQGACLENLDAPTQQNGLTSRVEGDASTSTFSVRKATTSKSIDECEASFAYSDKVRLLLRTALLNPQTGEYAPVTIENLGLQPASNTSGLLPVERFQMLDEQIDITVSYEQSTGRWLTLESRLEDGRALQYHLRRTDSAMPTSTTKAMQ